MMFKTIKVTYQDHNTNYMDYTPEAAKDFISKNYIKIFNDKTPTILHLVAPDNAGDYYFDEVRKIYFYNNDTLTQVLGGTKKRYNYNYYSDASKIPKTAVKWAGKWYYTEAYMMQREELKKCSNGHATTYYPDHAPACKTCKGIREQDNTGNRLYAYHSTPRALVIGQTSGSEILIGCEIEKEDSSVRIDKAALLKSGYIIERDSSLNSDSGYELITRPVKVSLKTPITEQPEVMAYFSNDLVKPLINAQASERCGGHIHISKINTKPRDLLFTIRNYLPLFFALYQKRAENSYCRLRNINDLLASSGRGAFSFSNFGTLEIRILPAVTNAGNLIWRIELLRIIFTTHCSNTAELVTMLQNPEHILTKHLLKTIRPHSLEQKINTIRLQHQLTLMNRETLQRYKHLLTIAEYKTSKAELLKSEMAREKLELKIAKREVKEKREQLQNMIKTEKTRRAEMLQNYQTDQEHFTLAKKYSANFNLI